MNTSKLKSSSVHEIKEAVLADSLSVDDTDIGGEAKLTSDSCRSLASTSSSGLTEIDGACPAGAGGVLSDSIDGIEEYYKHNNKKFCADSKSDEIFIKMPSAEDSPRAETGSIYVLKPKQIQDMQVGSEPEHQNQVPAEVPVKTVLTKVNNPLLMPEILEQIFDFMQRYQDEKTMLNICRVSRLWHYIMRKRMAKFETTEILKCPPSPVGPTSPTCKKFYLTLPIDNPAEFIRFCQGSGRQMKDLNISFKTCLEEADQIYPMNDTSIDSLFDSVQRYCPFVSGLNIWRNPLDIPPSDAFFKNRDSQETETVSSKKKNQIVLPFKEIVNMFWNDERGCDLLKQIISHSPNLESLTFMHSSTSVMIQVLRIMAKSPNKFKKLNSLRTIGMGINKEFINFVLCHEWNLKFLDIEVNDDNLSSDQIRSLLNHLGKSLKTIKIKFMDLEFNFGPSVQEWLLPVTMKALQCVELVVPSLSATACSSFFVNLFQLPQLKSFKLSQTARNYGGEDEMDEDMNNLNLFGILWNGHGSVLQNNQNQQHNHREKSLREAGNLISTLEIFNVSQTMTDASLFHQIPNPLENLMELKLQSVNVDVILAICASLKNLERLSFIADVFENVGEKTWNGKYWRNFSHLSERVLDWDEVLTGRMKKDGNGGKYRREEESQQPPEYLMLSTSPSIKNLQKLKYLYILPMGANAYLTDFFIYYGAIHLKSLQHLHIRENYFTENAVEDLRSELLPFCHLEVKCD